MNGLSIVGMGVVAPFGLGREVLAERVREAQAQFCREDSRCRLVPTDDLSRFYHFDAASMLVIGHRVAQAYQEALQMHAACPEARL